MSSSLRNNPQEKFLLPPPPGNSLHPLSQEKRKSPQLKTSATDSDGSGDTNSLSQESNTEVRLLSSLPGATGGASAGEKRTSTLNSEWEILEGLRDGQRYDIKPHIFSGFLHKKRKWPLKGWHKRYFVIDKGILVYGKSPSDVAKGKIHGSVDIGLSVVSTKQKRKRLDIDAEEFIYHLKAKQSSVFAEWVDQLRKHRLYRQHLLTYGGRNSIRGADTASPAGILRKGLDGSLSPPPLRLQWAFEATTLQNVTEDLAQVQGALNQLSRLIDQAEQADSENGSCGGPFLPGLGTLEALTSSSSPNVKKDRKKFGLRKKKSNKGSSSSVDLTVTGNKKDEESSSGLTTPSPSKPHSTPEPFDNNPFVAFQGVAKEIYSTLKSVHFALSTERDRLKTLVEEKPGREVVSSSSGSALLSSLRNTLHHALQQNAELRTRLAAIHASSDPVSLPTDPKTLSLSSSCVSEFYDAEDTLEGGEWEEERAAVPSESSSIAGSATSEEASLSSEASEMGDSEYNPGETRSNLTGRRSKLPCPRPSTEGLSLWNLLTKNIGKDLSQVSMPVALNEPLNMLQRLCEELEYSELLDKAAELTDRYERLLFIAAFAVSGYGSSYFRAGSKPFNPLLGETYENIREDKGFRFVAEQVSHHPPVSVCFAESKSWAFWQDVRIKTKFWGKSMEFQPSGTVNVKLERPDGLGADLYRWNKVTTCVHNLFSAQRWVDQYGELFITNDNISCRLTFVKASYWSAKRHEVHGTILDEEDRVVRTLFGKWSEALYVGVAPSARCIWRPGTMPEDHDLYYGFTRFAMELNELDQDMVKWLPLTDTRFRPDQRLLEEGKLDAAESTKLQLEQAQRERRKRLEVAGGVHNPKWFRKTISPSGEEVWEYTHRYWECRKSPGFLNMAFDPLW